MLCKMNKTTSHLSFSARVTKFKINWDGSEGAAENSENVPPKRDPNQLSDNSQVAK